jgi:uncharacterized membrane protein YhaH (DUF805 family)
MDMAVFTSKIQRVSRKTWWLGNLGIGFFTFFLNLFTQLIVAKTSPTWVLVWLIIDLVISLVFSAAMIVLSVKRLHDVGLAGWYYFLGLIPLIGTVMLTYWIAFQKGLPGANRYGQAPA